RLMANVVIATHHQVWSLFFKLSYVVLKILQKLHFQPLTLKVGTRRNVHAHNRKIAIICTDNAPFKIDIINTTAYFHVVGLVFCKNSHTAITLLLGTVIIAMITTSHYQFMVYLLRLSLGFLQAKYIRVGRCQPFHQSFF